jgi:uncharacterized protein YceH (UPF0502 family)
MMEKTKTTTWHVLGALIRTRFTDPAEIPCTADFLTATCNVAGTASPAAPIDKPEVHQALAELIKLGLVEVEETMGTFRYGERAASRFQLAPPEHALFGVLLLNPPLTAAELLRESYRLYPFRDEAQIIDAIHRLEEAHRVALARHWPPTDSGEPRYAHAHYEPTATQAGQTPAPHPADELEARVAELERLIDTVAPPPDHEH